MSKNRSKGFVVKAHVNLHFALTNKILLYWDLISCHILKNIWPHPFLHSLNMAFEHYITVILLFNLTRCPHNSHLLSYAFALNPI